MNLDPWHNYHKGGPAWRQYANHPARPSRQRPNFMSSYCGLMPVYHSVLNRFLNVKAVWNTAFNQKMALVVITLLSSRRFVWSSTPHQHRDLGHIKLSSATMFLCNRSVSPFAMNHLAINWIIWLVEHRNRFNKQVTTGTETDDTCNDQQVMHRFNQLE